MDFRFILAFLFGSIIFGLLSFLQVVQVFSLEPKLHFFLLPLLVGGVSGLYVALYNNKMTNAYKALKKTNADLTSLALKDSLTDLYNRRAFNERIVADWARWKRNDIKFSLLMIDIDFFKQYNDTYGHLAGDTCIKKVADALKSSVQRSEDLVSRYGGEEFVIIIPNTDETSSFEIAKKVHDNLKGFAIEHKTSKCSDLVTVSIGVALFDTFEKAKNFEDVIGFADEALYLAKANGRNTTHIYRY